MGEGDLMRLLKDVGKVVAVWAQSVDANPKAYMLISPLLCRQLDDLRATMDDLIRRYGLKL